MLSTSRYCPVEGRHEALQSAKIGIKPLDGR
jgi:hypothetical protein